MATKDRLKRDIQRAQAWIRAVIARSPVPEDPLHAEDTLSLLKELYPGADSAMELAALGHDIERALPWGIRVWRDHFADYDLFKWAHAQNSQRVMRGILTKCNLPEDLVEKVSALVLHHEQGGFLEADILKDVDSLSFFRVNLPLFSKREPHEKVVERIKWGIRRLSPKALDYLWRLVLQDPGLEMVKKYLPKN